MKGCLLVVLVLGVVAMTLGPVVATLLLVILCGVLMFKALS